MWSGAFKGDGSGSEPDGVVIGNEALANFTFCHVARYSGSARGRIFAGVTGNWLSGYWGSSAGVAHPEAWITSSSGANDTNWRVMCHTGGTTSGFRSNGVVRTTVTSNTTGLPANITINLQGSRTAPGDQTDWEVAEFVIYSGILNTFQIETIENQTPSGKLVSANQLARVIAWLLSEDSRGINGQFIGVDNGWSNVRSI